MISSSSIPINTITETQMKNKSISKVPLKEVDGNEAEENIQEHEENIQEQEENRGRIINEMFATEVVVENDE